MSLAVFLADADANRRTITVYSEAPGPELESRFDGWNVEVQFERLPPGTDEGFVTVRDDGQFLGSVDIAALSALFEPTAASAHDDRKTDATLGALLDLLDETLFRSETRRHLLAVSREFEDRAWRVGTGAIHAGFQRPAALRAQRGVYETLAERGLDVHIYADGEWGDPRGDGATAHATPDGELGRFWFVAYDGGTNGTIGSDADPETSQACALLAEECDSGSYVGIWTYDPDRVADFLDYLKSTYH